MSDAPDVAESSLARRLAPEEIRADDYIAILRETTEWPSFFWGSCSPTLAPDEPVRLSRRPTQPGTPLKVQSVCLPFVLVKAPDGKSKTLDLRACEVAKLAESFAKRAWKAHRRLPLND